MSRKMLCLVAALIFGCAVADTASANTVSIGGSINGGSIDTIASGNGSASVTDFTYGTYTINLSATGSPALKDPNFDSDTLTVKSNDAGTITLYASEINLTAIVRSFSLGFSNNPISDTSVSEAVYADDSNDPYGMGTLLGQSGALAPGDTTTDTASFASLSAPYSLTEVYTITFGANGGTVDAAISETATLVPLPGVAIGGMALMGILGLMKFSHRRRGATA